MMILKTLLPTPLERFMPIRVHTVSYRNGCQIMVRGLPLGAQLGYSRHAHVKVSDPSNNPTNPDWVYVVDNDEHATLVCSNPPPPPWIQAGVEIISR